MKPKFVAGFGPIVADGDAPRAFWGSALGIDLTEMAPGYWTNDHLDGVKAFGLWPLSQAAQACFGSPAWPDSMTVPQAWIEFDVETPDAVGAGAADLEKAGYKMLTQQREEPWGQTTAHLLSPEGLLVGVTYTPWMH
jgi:hypothetical protein